MKHPMLMPRTRNTTSVGFVVAFPFTTVKEANPKTLSKMILFKTKFNVDVPEVMM